MVQNKKRKKRKLENLEKNEKIQKTQKAEKKNIYIYIYIYQNMYIEHVRIENISEHVKTNK